MNRFLIPFIVFTLVAIMLGVSLCGNPKALKSKSKLLNQIAPRIYLPSLDGKTTVESVHFKGHWVAINFWAEWCVECIKEIPHLVKLSKQTKIKLYGVNYLDVKDKARAFLVRHGNPYIASGFDPDGLTGVDWGITAVPETFLIDPRGIIRHRHLGPVNQFVIKQFKSIVNASKSSRKSEARSK